MSAGYCLQCGLKLPKGYEQGLHEECALWWIAERTRIEKAPKTRIEQQLDRIEILLQRIESNNRQPPVEWPDGNVTVGWTPPK